MQDFKETDIDARIAKENELKETYEKMSLEKLLEDEDIEKLKSDERIKSFIDILDKQKTLKEALNSSLTYQHLANSLHCTPTTTLTDEAKAYVKKQKDLNLEELIDSLADNEQQALIALLNHLAELKKSTKDKDKAQQLESVLMSKWNNTLAGDITLATASKSAFDMDEAITKSEQMQKLMAKLPPRIQRKVRAVMKKSAHKNVGKKFKEALQIVAKEEKLYDDRTIDATLREYIKAKKGDALNITKWNMEKDIDYHFGIELAGLKHIANLAISTEYATLSETLTASTVSTARESMSSYSYEAVGLDSYELGKATTKIDDLQYEIENLESWLPQMMGILKDLGMNDKNNIDYKAVIKNLASNELIEKLKSLPEYEKAFTLIEILTKDESELAEYDKIWREKFNKLSMKNSGETPMTKDELNLDEKTLSCMRQILTLVGYRPSVLYNMSTKSYKDIMKKISLLPVTEGVSDKFAEFACKKIAELIKNGSRKNSKSLSSPDLQQQLGTLFKETMYAIKQEQQEQLKIAEKKKLEETNKVKTRRKKKTGFFRSLFRTFAKNEDKEIVKPETPAPPTPSTEHTAEASPEDETESV